MSFDSPVVSKNSIVVPAAILLCISVTYLASHFYPMFAHTQESLRYPGSLDFLEYWSAFKLWAANTNPYDGQAMLTFQRELVGIDAPIMMWNPPWVLVLLSPILQLDFHLSTQIWFILNLLFTLFSLHLVLQVLGCRGALYLALGLTLLFLPLRSTLHFGQLGCLLLFGCTLVLVGLANKKDLISGFGLMILSFKPHLFYLVFIVLGWEILSKRDYKRCFALFSPFVLLALASLLMAPRLMSWWIDSIISPQNDSPATPVLSWIGPNLPSLIRRTIDQFQLAHIFGNSVIFSLFIPALIAISVFAFLIYRRPVLNWVILFGPLLALSTYTAPFGWVFDQTVLVIFVCQILADSFSSTRLYWVTLSSIICVNVVLAYYEHISKFHHEIPASGPILLCLWFLLRRYNQRICKETNLQSVSSKP